MMFRVHEMEFQDRLLQFGDLTEEDVDFFTIETEKSRPLTFENMLFMLRYEMSLTKFIRERTVYGVLDWMGDVGGFVDALRLLSFFFLFTFSFDPVNVFLVQQLFKYNKDQTIAATMGGGSATISDIGRQEWLRVGWLSSTKLTLLSMMPCKRERCLTQKEKAYFNACDVLNKEANIVYIIKELRVLRAALTQ